MIKKITFPAKIMKNEAITVPLAAREKSGLKPGDVVTVTLEWEEEKRG
jgi:bifunctional DNA-binding transcriptional regulator/antitoxin component of YhaV-PrlF toxin-antitoxin module